MTGGALSASPPSSTTYSRIPSTTQNCPFSKPSLVSSVAAIPPLSREHHHHHLCSSNSKVKPTRLTALGAIAAPDLVVLALVLLDSNSVMTALICRSVLCMNCVYRACFTKLRGFWTNSLWIMIWVYRKKCEFGVLLWSLRRCGLLMLSMFAILVLFNYHSILNKFLCRTVSCIYRAYVWN